MPDSRRTRCLRLLVGLALLALALLAGIAWWARGAAGAGALHQFAPAAVKPGEAFEIRVQASTWGAGRGPAARYRDWSLQLMQDGRPIGPALHSTSVRPEGDQQVVIFEVIAPQISSAGAMPLTWRLRFSFDGQPKEVEGPHPIELDGYR